MHCMLPFVLCRPLPHLLYGVIFSYLIVFFFWISSYSFRLRKKKKKNPNIYLIRFSTHSQSTGPSWCSICFWHWSINMPNYIKLTLLILNPVPPGKWYSYIVCGQCHCLLADLKGLGMQAPVIHNHTFCNWTVIYHATSVLLRLKQFWMATSAWKCTSPRINRGLLSAIFHLPHLQQTRGSLMSPIISWAFEMHELLLEVTAQ